jgi:flavin-dependent dehydrogenase
MARRGHEAIQLAGQVSWFQSSGNLAWTILLAGCAVGFLSPGMGRTFAYARALLAAEREARANRISLEFTRAEATVLLDWTWRTQAALRRSANHPSDQKVLDDFERYLKRKILTADAPSYHLLLASARQELTANAVAAPLS